jgi:hypothetical protein
MPHSGRYLRRTICIAPERISQIYAIIRAQTVPPNFGNLMRLLINIGLQTLIAKQKQELTTNNSPTND